MTPPDATTIRATSRATVSTSCDSSSSLISSSLTLDTDGGGGATGVGSDGVVLVTLSLLLVGTDDGLLEEEGLVSLLS